MTDADALNGLTFRQSVLAALSAADAVDTILDLAPSDIHVVTRKWSGTVGTRPFTDISTFALQGPLPARQDGPKLKVRHLSARFVAQSGGRYEMGDLMVGPIRPYFTNPLTSVPGGFMVRELDPPNTDDATEVFWRVKQVNQAGSGVTGDYRVIHIDETDALFYKVVIRRLIHPGDSILEPGDDGFNPGVAPIP